MNDIKKKLFELTLNLQTHQQAVFLAVDGSPEQSRALKDMHMVASQIVGLTKTGADHEPADDWPEL